MIFRQMRNESQGSTCATIPARLVGTMWLRLMIPLFMLPTLCGCGAGAGVEKDEAPVMSGNPVRDSYATDLHDFKRASSPSQKCWRGSAARQHR